MGFLLWRSQDPLLNDARAATQALRNGNGAALLAYATEEEVRNCRLDAAKVERLIREVTLRGYGGWKVEGLEFEPYGDPPTSIMAVLRLRSEAGEPGALTLSLARAEDSGKTMLLYELLGKTWSREKAMATKGKYRPAEAWLDGLQKDRGLLQSLDIPGIYLGPEIGYVTWEEFELGQKRKLAAMHAEPVPEP